MNRETILAILKRYGVRTHYQESRRAKTVRYAVYGPNGQIGGPCTHAEARAFRDELIAHDILENAE